MAARPDLLVDLHTQSAAAARATLTELTRSRVESITAGVTTVADTLYQELGVTVADDAPPSRHAADEDPGSGVPTIELMKWAASPR
jgi:hypothetical protein